MHFFARKLHHIRHFGKKVISAGVNFGRKIINNASTISSVAHVAGHALKHIADHQSTNFDRSVGRLHNLSTLANDIHETSEMLHPMIRDSHSARFV